MKLHPAFFDLKQFVLSKDKVPYDYVTNRKINAFDEQHWITGKEAFQSGKDFNFVITPGWFLIDLDHCIDENFDISDIAIETIDKFKKCYIEVSKSRTGLHIIGRLENQSHEHNCKNTSKHIEVYTELRTVLITGRNASGDPTHAADDLLNGFINEYVPSHKKQENFTEWTDKPVEEWSGPSQDEILVQRMLKNPKAARLWDGDLSDYNNDKSSGDFALCMYLAFWTGKNCKRIEHIFNLSELGKREKWQKREDYRKATILRACEDTIAVAQVKKGTLPSVVTASEYYNMTDINENGNICTVDMQKEYFRNCVYLESGCRVFDKSRYATFDKNEFNGIYNKFIFMMDKEGDKTTEDAYKAFRDNRSYRPTSVRDVRYEPSEPYGAILEGIKWSGYDGVRYVNAFGMPNVYTVDGDSSIFHDFVKKLLPDENDRKILYGYIAGVAQNRGKKIRWCPVIQGAQGNGKTTIMRVLEYIVGSQVSITKNAEEVFADNFNGWMEGKIFIGIDEMKAKTARENSDKLNNLITGHTIGIRRMYADWIHYRNFINFMICTNFKDAIEINEDTRRWCIFYTAQQTHEDVIKSGLTPDYFIELNDWLDNEGFAILADYFRNYEIEERYNPFKQARAPKTSSLSAATMDSLPPAVKKILESVEEGVKGFRGGWISKSAVSAVLGYKVTRWRDITEALNRCGYVSIEKRTCDLPTPQTMPSYSPGQMKIRHSLFVLKTKDYNASKFSEEFLNDQKE
jgi:hypothetical protein